MHKDEKQQVVEEILKLADGLFRELLPSVPKELLDLDVTMPQMKIMLILFMRGPQRMSDLASDLAITLATTTGLVDRLVERDFIIRENSPDDRRVVLCRLSENGQKAVGRLWKSARNRSGQLLAAMEVSKLNMFREALEAMLNSAEKTNSIQIKN
jgi:DNA-binding MarR family transcriptional regulator